MMHPTARLVQHPLWGGRASGPNPSRRPVCSPQRTLVLLSNDGGLTTRPCRGADAHAGLALGSTGQDPPKLGKLILQAAGAVGLDQLVQAEGVILLAHNLQLGHVGRADLLGVLDEAAVLPE